MKKQDLYARHYASRETVRLRWQNGTITQYEVLPDQTAPAWWIAPGLLDLQVNGYGGVDFQSEGLNAEALLRAVRGLRAAGCTRFLLTLTTDEWSALTAKLRHLRELRSQSEELQVSIAGWHIEGPFLSAEPGFHGAHDPSLLLDPTSDHIHELRALTQGDPLMLTIAPERKGAIEAIRLAVTLGARVSLGHTNASVQVLADAIAAGATGFTHLGNACPQALDRHDNIIWRVFETPGLTVSLIPDRIHVSPALFRLVHRILPIETIYYVSDAMAAAGSPPGRYRFGKTEVDVGVDRVVRQSGKTHFAGSAVCPVDAVFHAAEMLGISWQEAWGRYVLAPADMAGLPSGFGLGQRADFCLVKVSPKDKLTELKVFFGGQAGE